MKMQLKRIVSGICAVALCASVVTTPVFAEETDLETAPAATTAETTADTAPETTPAAPAEDTPSAPEDTTQQDPAPTAPAGEPAGEPEAADAPADDPNATRSAQDSGAAVLTCSNQSYTVHVGETITVSGQFYAWSDWRVSRQDQALVTLSEKANATVQVTGMQPGTVKLYHEGLLYEEVICVTVLPAEQPAGPSGEIYFFVSLPDNESLSMEGSDYRFLVRGGSVSDKASEDLKGENAVISDDEAEIQSYASSWPSTVTLGDTGGQDYGSVGVDAGSMLTLDENGNITDFRITFTDNENQTITYAPEDADGNHYELRWTKFSYADTSDADWQYHMDAMLYKVITVDDALNALTVRKAVDGYALDETGAETDSHFTFTLASADKNREIRASLTAEVTANGSKTVDVTAGTEADGDTVLLPGTYTITEDPTDDKVWQTGDSITFTVATDGTVALASGTADATIDNLLKTYTVTYASGVEGDTGVSGMPADANAYPYQAVATAATAPSRTGYDFAGWTDGTSRYAVGDAFSITGDVTLTALWEETPQPGGSGTAGQAGKVELDKTATELDENNQTDVTLRIGAAQEERDAYVLFVLDKSTSNDVREEAADMLEELKGQADAGYTIHVAVLGFERQVQSFLDWTDLTEANYTSIRDSLLQKRSESGTNIYLALREAQNKMDALTGVDAAYKHVVLVTDGITYLWSNSEDPTDTSLYSIYSESISNGEESINAGNDMMKSHHPEDYAAFISELTDMKSWLAKYGAGVAADIAQYQHVYTAGQYKADEKGHTTESTYANAGFGEGEYIPGESLTQHFSANEGAIYMAATQWQQMVQEGYHLYAYADVTDGGNSTNAATYPWASNFICGLGTIGGNTGLATSAAVDGMFEDVKSSVLYALDHGTVTDVIGDDFDLAGLDTFRLTVGGRTLEGTVNEAERTVSFDSGNYVVTYAPDGQDGDAREQFQWTIHTPVKSDEGLQLTYTLNLVNQSDAVGDHQVPTNEEASLTYISTAGGTGTEAFPVPTVAYHVAKLEPAAMTIYMGGEEGYEGVSEENGEIVGSNSLPQPGFYVTLPDEVNQALQAANIQPAESTGSQPVNLSAYIKMYTTDPTDPRVWKLASYGASYSAAYGKYIYAVIPDPATDTEAFRLNFVDADGTAYDSDTFVLADQDKLSQQYTMEVYPELVAKHQVILEVDIPKTASTEAVSYRCTMVTGTAELNIRYVTQGEHTTQVSTDIGKTSEAEDAAQTALHNAYVVRDAETKFYINESKVDVDEENFAQVSLLFDDIVSEQDSGEAAHYETALKDTALTRIDASLKDVKYQAKYLDLVDANNGNVWLTPSKAVTVYWPYPEGTNANTKFYLVHFKDLDRDAALEDVESSIASADTELMPLQTDKYGISFQTDSFSPFVLVWDGAQGQTGASDDSPAATPKPVSVTSSKPAQPQPTAAPVLPQTGDALPVGLLGGLTAAAAAALAVLFVVRKRKND